MKTNITYSMLIALGVACLAVPRGTRAACPEICDDSRETTAVGNSALASLTTGGGNTAVGRSALEQNTTGSQNTAIGSFALQDNAGGRLNTATGVFALEHNQGSFNTATGVFTLTSNQGNNNTATGAYAGGGGNGSDNTATGYRALAANGMDAMDNTAVGSGALAKNFSASFNTAVGFNALTSNTASNNTAVGFEALFHNATGTGNTATGGAALFNNTTGQSNTAASFEALFSNTTGSNNTACGELALENNTTGGSNIGLGFLAGSNLTTGSNNIDIGANVTGVVGEANTIRIGKSGTQKKTFVAGIRGVTVPGGVGVIVGATGQLGTVVSSARFKEAIKPMDKASETILALKPVTFRYKEELDPDKIPQFGLVAEEVEKVDPDLVARDEEGKIMSVRYEAVNAMLLNEFLKEHRKVQELEKQIEVLTAGLQKVTAEVESYQTARRVVSDN